MFRPEGAKFALVTLSKSHSRGGCLSKTNSAVRGLVLLFIPARQRHSSALSRQSKFIIFTFPSSSDDELCLDITQPAGCSWYFNWIISFVYVEIALVGLIDFLQKTACTGLWRTLYLYSTSQMLYLTILTASLFTECQFKDTMNHTIDLLAPPEVKSETANQVAGGDKIRPACISPHSYSFTCLTPLPPSLPPSLPRVCVCQSYSLHHSLFLWQEATSH